MAEMNNTNSTGQAMMHIPQPMRVPMEEFARIFQEIGKLAAAALSKAGLPQ